MQNAPLSGCNIIKQALCMHACSMQFGRILIDARSIVLVLSLLMTYPESCPNFLYFLDLPYTPIDVTGTLRSTYSSAVVE